MEKEQIVSNNNKQRLFYLDNLKWLMIIFVVMMHAACTYSGAGLWYYQDVVDLDKVSIYTFMVYQSFSQAYFMSLYFFIAGYFVPSSLAKKGTRKFISERLTRLGIPTIIYIFIINPICVKLANPNIDIVQYLWHGIISLQFFAWTGPLWFAVALIIFSVFYLCLRPLCNKLLQYEFAITIKNILLLIVIIAFFAFGLRMFFPFGTTVLNFQLGNFSAYIIMFLLGTLSQQKHILEKISYNIGRGYFLAAFVIGVPLWIITIRRLMQNSTLTIDLSLLSGWSFTSLLYAVWESFFCVTIIIALLGIFKQVCNNQNRWQKFLSDNCFGVYVFHAPVLIFIAELLQSIIIQPLIKWILATILATIGSLIISWVLRKNGLCRKIFS